MAIINLGKSISAQLPINETLNLVDNVRNKVSTSLTGGLSIGSDGISLNANFNSLIEAKKQGGNLVRSPLKSLYAQNQEGLSFPRDLDNDHFMVFKVFNSTRESRRQTKPKRKTLRTIALPVPNNLQLASGVDYENAALGGLGAAAAGRVSQSQVSQFKDDARMLAGKMVDTAKSIGAGELDTAGAGKLAAVGAAGAAIAGGGAVAGFLGSALALGGVNEIGQGLLLDEGLAINPHMAVLFKGVGFREHSFQYKFVARSQQESLMIDKIVKAFEFHMHPEYSYGGLGFNYPDEFEISFSPKISEYLFTIKNSVLKNFTVNYNGENLPLFFEQTGAPVSVEINLGFQETQITTKSDTAIGRNGA